MFEKISYHETELNSLQNMQYFKWNNLIGELGKKY